MAALAYLFPPLTGLIAYLKGDGRARFHGLQSVVLGIVFPAALYGCSQLSARATQACAAVEFVLWALLIGLTASGRDPAIPILGKVFRAAAGATDEPRSTSGTT